MTIPAAAPTISEGPACPIPIDRYPTVTMAHGGGGRLSDILVRELLLEAYGSEELNRLGDGALLDLGPGRLAFSTDSFVVYPHFFPGGDIGSLAVHGTVNDVAMCGATPKVLSIGLILEEGFPMEALWRIARSIRTAADEAGVRIVTGDTKVVDRGKGDGIFINTTGIGVVDEGVDIGAHRIAEGDAVLISGPIANHGIAILSLREGLEFETLIETDSAPLHGLATRLRTALGSDLHALRDPTRGGVASALNELARASALGIHIEEARLPLDAPVRGACEILGLDPLYVANEGKLIAFVAGDRADEALERLRTHPLGRGAAIIGRVADSPTGRVIQKSRIGGSRVVEMLSGEQLPRIC
jgi:hydrogenase expression/formation protein HypE